jgi:hypothetical protein
MRDKVKEIYYTSARSIFIASELKSIVEYVRLKRRVTMAGVSQERLVKVRDIRRDVAQVTHKTCHIIGSGLSVLSSIQSIDVKNDFVIGFNYAGLLPLEFDVYFLEHATDTGSLAESSGIHEDLYFEMCTRRQPEIYVKCLWGHDWWSPSFINNRYAGNLALLFDVPPNLPLLANSQILNLANQEIFRKKRSSFFINGASSAVFSVLFAYQLGFRNIVVHGVDFLGPHFFHSKELIVTKLMERVRETCPEVPVDFVHGAGKWMSLQWPHVIRALARSGVTVYSGTRSSLFSTYAPVYIPFIDQKYEIHPNDVISGNSHLLVRNRKSISVDSD